MTQPVLPTPRRTRFQPLRGGLLNLYLYDDQRFEYEDGRLLLRGSNGTGKSRVLALQLPFLLDGRVEPRRVEPDGDPAKRMEWHLLMGQRYPDRVGYTWIEFGRLRDGDEAEYVTLCIGMHAVRGRGAPTRWFAVTRKRLDEGLSLIDVHGAPLTRPGLEAAIGEDGHVYRTAEEYRAEVDRQLFGLGTARYEALLDLLIELRRPQLSRTLDERKLSQALSEALPPLDETVVRDVADALSKVEQDREELTGVRRALAQVDAFVKVHHHYLRVETRLRAHDLRSANASYEELGRKKIKLEKDRGVEADRLRDLHARKGPLVAAHEELSAELEALRASDAMRSAQMLERLDKELTQLEARHAAAVADAKSAETAHARLTDEQAEAEQQWRTQLVRVREDMAQLGELAVAAGMPAGSLEPLTQAETQLAEGRHVDLRGAAKAAKRAVRAHRDQVEHVRGLQRGASASEAKLQQALRAQNDAQRALDDAHEERARASQRRQETFDAVVEAYAQWSADAKELRAAPVQEVAALLEAFVSEPTGVTPTQATASAAFARCQTDLLEHRASLVARLETLEPEIEAARADCKRLRAGETPQPARLPGRDLEGRERRPGAALWQACDFAEGMPEAERAGLEAALEAAGLLDAWIPVDGQVALEATRDAWLVPLAIQDSQRARTLADVLVPARDPDDPKARDLSAERIKAVLRSVGLEQGEIHVGSDGRYRLGPLQGRHSKDAAEFLGHGAREAARKRALQKAEATLADLERRRSELERSRHAVDERLAQAKQELAAAPDGEGLRRAVSTEATADRDVARAQDRLRERAGETERARSTHEAAVEALQHAAQELGLAAHLHALDALLRALGRVDDRIDVATGAMELALHNARAWDRAKTRTQQASSDLAERLRARDAAAAQARIARTELATLRATAGAEAARVVALVKECEGKRAANERQRDELEQEVRKSERALSGIEAKLEELAPTIAQHNAAREGAATAFRELCATSMLAALHDDFDPWADASTWSTTRTIEVARSVEKAISAVDMDADARDRARTRVQGGVRELQAALAGQQLDPRVEERHQLYLVLTPLNGKDLSLTQLQSHFGREVEERERILQEEERRVIENHVIDQLATHLQQRIRTAGELVVKMGEELASRPLGTGMRISLKWAPDKSIDEAFLRVRKLLDSADSLWTPEERNEVAEFLRERIEQARNAESEGGGGDHLQRALDYRSWHQFAVYREQDGQVQRLTKRTHGTGSGGEKAIALTLPQLAAASAHYQSARDDAPRIILMDEVFVGVDSDMRKKCMGLLCAFDLDVVMTSEREWGCYPTVPALAIYQLVTRPGVDAIHATRWVWNGKERKLANGSARNAS